MKSVSFQSNLFKVEKNKQDILVMIEKTVSQEGQ